MHIQGFYRHCRLGEWWYVRVLIRLLTRQPVSFLTSELRPLPNWPFLTMMIASMRGLSRGLAHQLKPVRVNVVALGAVDTDLFKNIWAEKTTEEKQSIVEGMKAQAATGMIGKPEDVAEAYIYCMRDYNLTGTTINSSSGQLIMQRQCDCILGGRDNVAG